MIPTSLRSSKVERFKRGRKYRSPRRFFSLGSKPGPANEPHRELPLVTLTSSRLIPTRLLTPVVASFLLTISTFAQTSGAASPQPVPSIKGNVLQVGIYRGKPEPPPPLTPVNLLRILYSPSPGRF